MEKFFHKPESYWQNGIYLILFALIVWLCWPLAPTPNPDARGIFLPNNGNSLNIIDPALVEVVNAAPITALLVGTISTKIHYSGTSASNDDQNMQKSLVVAKQLAAAHGANMLVLTQIGRTIDDGPLDGFVIQAEAYHG